MKVSSKQHSQSTIVERKCQDVLFPESLYQNGFVDVFYFLYADHKYYSSDVFNYRSLNESLINRCFFVVSLIVSDATHSTQFGWYRI